MAGKGGARYLLMKHKPQIIRELDVSRTLPPLVNRGIFNYSEEQEIVQHTDPRRRTETFVDLLSMKGLQLGTPVVYYGLSILRGLGL